MIRKLKPNIFQLHFQRFGSCVYVLRLDKLIVIDTSSKQARPELLEDLKELNIKPEQVDIVILTHQHWDHNENIDLFNKVKIYDATNIDKLPLKEFRIIKTPGHTEDSFCILYQDILFSGDTIFHNGGRGRTDLSGGNEEKMQNSLDKLKKINYKILCPGHIN